MLATGTIDERLALARQGIIAAGLWDVRRSHVEDAMQLAADYGVDTLYIGADMLVFTSGSAEFIAANPYLGKSHEVGYYRGMCIVVTGPRGYLAATPPCARCGDVLPRDARHCIACGALISATGDTVRLDGVKPATGKTVRL